MAHAKQLRTAVCELKVACDGTSVMPGAGSCSLCLRTQRKRTNQAIKAAKIAQELVKEARPGKAFKSYQ